MNRAAALLLCLLLASSAAHSVGRLNSGSSPPYSKIADPSISGTPTVLENVTVTPGTYTGVTSTRTYQLYRDGVAVPGTWTKTSTAPWTYILNGDDLAVASLTFQETVNKTAGGTATTSTNAIGPVAEATVNVTSKGQVAASTRSFIPNIDGLLISFQWDCGGASAYCVFSFSFPAAGTDYYSPGVCSDYSATMQPCTGFAAFTSTQQDQVRAALREIERAGTRFRFVEYTGANAKDAIFRYAHSSAVSICGGAQPTATHAGDVWCPPSAGLYATFQKATFGFYAIVHETGHAMGMPHPMTGQFWGPMDPPQDASEYTVMSYCNYVVATPTGCVGVSTSSEYSSTIMSYDIQAYQWMYGVGLMYNQSDTVYTWDTTTGETFINGVGQGAPVANVVALTTWCSGASCIYDLSNYPSGSITCSNFAGSFMITSDAQRPDWGGGHRFQGSIYTQLLDFSTTRSCVLPP